MISFTKWRQWSNSARWWAKSLGSANFDVGIEMWRTAPLEDGNGKWNNTFTHPSSDHWLTADDHTLKFIVPRGRAGITDRIDVEAMYAPNPGSNYAFFGLAVKFSILDGVKEGWSVAVRPSYSTVLGVADMNYNSLAVDLLVSREIWLFRPYGGFTILHGVASETTTKVNLHDETVNALDWVIGSEFNWKHLSMELEADIGSINMYSLKVGVAF